MADFRVVVTDNDSSNVDIEEELIRAIGGEVFVAADAAEARRMVVDADAILNTYLPIDRAMISSMGQAKIIARYGIGVDNVNVVAAKEAGIAVTNVPDYCIEEVATHTIALMLMMLRRVPESEQIVRSGGWGVTRIGEIRRLSTLTVGVLGAGRIATRVAGIVEALGARVVLHDPYVDHTAIGRLVPFGELLASSDVLLVHCPLTPGTRHLIDAAALLAMPSCSYLVNAARGPIVVFDDLVDALIRHHLAGAALDVFEQEPPDAEKIRSTPNLVVTPHSAFLSKEARRESRQKAVLQVVKALRGEPLDYPV